MQFQSDVLKKQISVPDAEELSAMGVAYMLGMTMGIWDDAIVETLNRTIYRPCMESEKRQRKIDGWRHAMKHVLNW